MRHFTISLSDLFLSLYLTACANIRISRPAFFDISLAHASYQRSFSMFSLRSVFPLFNLTKGQKKKIDRSSLSVR